MELSGAITAMRQAELAGKVQFAVARKILDHQRQQGSAAVQMIQSAASVATRAGDELVAAATGLGGRLDTYA